MKMLLVLSGRIVVILLAALVVVGITMRVVDPRAASRFSAAQRTFAPSAATVDNPAGRAAGNSQGALAPQTREGRAFRGERHSPRA